jgi:hypothetical protein
MNESLGANIVKELDVEFVAIFKAGSMIEAFLIDLKMKILI